MIPEMMRPLFFSPPSRFNVLQVSVSPDSRHERQAGRQAGLRLYMYISRTLDATSSQRPIESLTVMQLGNVWDWNRIALWRVRRASCQLDIPVKYHVACVLLCESDGDGDGVRLFQDVSGRRAERTVSMICGNGEPADGSEKLGAITLGKTQHGIQQKTTIWGVVESSSEVAVGT